MKSLPPPHPLGRSDPFSLKGESKNLVQRREGRKIWIEVRCSQQAPALAALKGTRDSCSFGFLTIVHKVDGTDRNEWQRVLELVVFHLLSEAGIRAIGQERGEKGKWIRCRGQRRYVTEQLDCP